MIEIKCTQKEKEKLICCIANPDNYCIFPMSRELIDKCKTYDSCYKCVEKTIKWVITEESN